MNAIVIRIAVICREVKRCEKQNSTWRNRATYAYSLNYACVRGFKMRVHQLRIYHNFITPHTETDASLQRHNDDDGRRKYEDDDSYHLHNDR